MSEHATVADLLAPQQVLGVAEMDDTHREFLELCGSARQAGAAEFAARLQALHEHTDAHFAYEEALMLATGFPAIAEHTAEHRRVLGELQRFGARAAAGNTALARAWLREQVPEWFRAHLASMDSALAAHLKARNADVRLPV